VVGTSGVTTPVNSDIELVRLAREIAMDILPLDAILKSYGISESAWAALQYNSKFQKLLASESETWSTALNTNERVRFKAAAMIEEWLPELHLRMHDREESLTAKIEASKMLSRLAGMGGPEGIAVAGGERFVVTINMGPQVSPLEFTKDVNRVIEGELVTSQGNAPEMAPMMDQPPEPARPMPPESVWPHAQPAPTGGKERKKRSGRGAV
jgi:hypothetical protein